jgi:hypothetical protein
MRIQLYLSNNYQLFNRQGDFRISVGNLRKEEVRVLKNKEFGNGYQEMKTHPAPKSKQYN